MFNLEKALASWRRQFKHRRAFLAEDLDELERHLRDHIADLVAEGLEEKAAFRQAARALGASWEAEAEYRKVYWGKLSRKHRRLDEFLWRLVMRKNYLKIALRNLRRQKTYAFINVFGLAVGLATCLLIGAFIRHEASFDRFHPTADRVYRVYKTPQPTSMLGLTQALEDRFPEIEHATLVSRPWQQLLAREGESFFLEDVVYADSQFLDVFPFPLLRGNPREVLAGPGQMVLTRSTAHRFFGDEDPIGKTFMVENREEYTVVGVMEDVPSNAHFRFTALFSLDGRARQQRYNSAVQWNRFVGSYLYVLLDEHTRPEALETKIRAFEAEERKALPALSQEPQLRLQPLTSIHLHATDLTQDIAPQSDTRYLYLFSAIGLLILLIACVNYMNLATARSAERAKEVGVRKVIGAYRSQLINQFLSESMLLALLAVPLALALAYVALPLIAPLMERPLSLHLFEDGLLLAALGGGVVLIGLLAGSYPALFLSRFHPVRVLSSHGRSMGRGGLMLRRLLVIFQFTVAMVLFVATAVMIFQLDYIQNKRLGFDQEHVVSFSIPGALKESYETFKQELLRQPAVAEATSGAPPGIGWATAWTDMPADDGEEEWPLTLIEGDYSYLETLGIKLVAGRAFEPERSTDAEEAIILSEAAARRFNLPEDPTGQRVSFMWFDDVEVIGVVEDIHNTSLHEALVPMAIGLRAGANPRMLVRLRAGMMQDGLADVASVWQHFVPDRPFQFKFLNDQIGAQYQAEQKLMRLFTLFSGLAIFVACLGLFGLASFTAEARTKEIGIRKALGASVSSIITLLSTTFIKLVLVAFVVAAPLAYFAMQQWLQDFVYRIEISWPIFLMAGLAALGIALLTVSYQAVRAALANPVKALRYE